MNNIAIVGTGWLGLPLAQRLIFHGKSVYGTRTTKQRLNELKRLAIPCFELSLNSTPYDSNSIIIEKLHNRNISTVIGAFPPGFKKGEDDAYAQRWGMLINSSIQAGVKKIIMISATSVYPMSNNCMVENDACLPLTEHNANFSKNARTMLKAEQTLINATGIDHVILRMSGLFGPQRHPARFINKLRSLSTVAPVNMLHQEDAINAVIFSLDTVHNQILNVTSPNTVSKFEFYKKAIHRYDPQLILPKLNDNPAKKISANKLIQLGFKFKYENVLEGLDHCD